MRSSIPPRRQRSAFKVVFAASCPSPTALVHPAVASFNAPACWLGEGGCIRQHIMPSPAFIELIGMYVLPLLALQKQDERKNPCGPNGGNRHVQRMFPLPRDLRQMYSLLSSAAASFCWAAHPQRGRPCLQLLECSNGLYVYDVNAKFRQDEFARRDRPGNGNIQ